MNMFDWVQIFIFIVALLAITPPLGMYMAKVYLGRSMRSLNL